MTNADKCAAAAPQAFKVGDAVRQISGGRRATVERIFTCALPGQESACALACRIEDGERRPVYIYDAAELEPA